MGQFWARIYKPIISKIKMTNIRGRQAGSFECDYIPCQR